MLSSAILAGVTLFLSLAFLPLVPFYKSANGTLTLIREATENTAFNAALAQSSLTLSTPDQRAQLFTVSEQSLTNLESALGASVCALVRYTGKWEVPHDD